MTLACAASGLIVVGPSGQLSELVMQNGHSFDHAVRKGQVPEGGRVIAAQDFDGNGSTDLVLEYDPDGTGSRPRGTFLWRFDGSTRISVTQLGGIPSSYTYSVGVCDIDHDGNWEYMLADNIRGNVKFYEVIKSAPYAGGDRWVFPGGYQNYSDLVGVADINSDGECDLLLQDPATKRLRYRYRFGLGSSRLASKPLTILPPGKVVGEYNAIGTFNGVTYSGYICESIDGVRPRALYIYQDQDVSSIDHFYLDEAYRSWPIVAVVP